MKRIIFIVVCFLICFRAYAAYYYYNGQRVYISINYNKYVVYSSNYGNSLVNSVGASSSYKLQEVSRIDASVRNNPSVTSIEYCIQGNNGQYTQMSNRFYVKLRSASDLSKLRQVANRTNTIIVGQVPLMTNWYELIVNNKSNSLDMSNYFYETGYFEDIDPGFIFDFKTTASCVSDRQVSQQWGLDAINACQAWDITKGSSM